MSIGTSRNTCISDTSDYPKWPPSLQHGEQKSSRKDERRVRRAPHRRVRGPAPQDVLYPGGKNIKKAKGVKKNVVKKHIRHEQYKEALFDRKTFRHGMDVLRSEGHRIYGQHLNKVSLSLFDSKRWIAKNGIDTLAYGNKDVVSAMDDYVAQLING